MLRCRKVRSIRELTAKLLDQLQLGYGKGLSYFLIALSYLYDKFINPHPDSPLLIPVSHDHPAPRHTGKRHLHDNVPLPAAPNSHQLSKNYDSSTCKDAIKIVGNSRAQTYKKVLQHLDKDKFGVKSRTINQL